MEPLFTVTPDGFLLTIDATSYVMTWVGDMLKVTGPDTCYYLLETAKGLEQMTCNAATSTLIVAN